MAIKWDKKFVNILVLGFSFMLIFTAFNSCSMIQTLVLNSVHLQDPSFNGDGYISLAIIYIVFALANWLSPSVIAIVGSKYAMIIGAATYSLFIGQFLKPTTWALYLCSAIMGFGAACIWTGQGNFLTVNSTSETIGRNSGVFWALLQCSMLFGNLFVYFQFLGEETISDRSRTIVFSVLLAASILGLLLMFLFRIPDKQVSESEDKEKEVEKSEGPIQALIDAARLMKTKEIILLSFPFFYSGVEMGFFSGVYGTSIGFTQQFGTIAKSLVGINGMLIGAGEILGGAVFGLLGKKTSRHGRDGIFLLGFIIHMIAYYLTFINLPPDSPLGETSTITYIIPNKYLALFCSFLYGFGDSCFNTQIFSILGFMYPEDSVSAFALFKFMQSLAAAINFFYCTALQLPWQLLILVITGTSGLATFCFVEWQLFIKQARLKRQSVQEIN